MWDLKDLKEWFCFGNLQMFITLIFHPQDVFSAHVCIPGLTMLRFLCSYKIKLKPFLKLSTSKKEVAFEDPANI